MIAYYDLQQSPPTYDVVGWLMWAEHCRRQRNASNLDIHVLPGPSLGFRADSVWPYTREERLALRDNALLPILRLMPGATVTNHVTRPERRENDSIGFDEMHHGLRVILENLRHGIRPLRSPNHCRRDPKLVTITLRECVNTPKRNSDVDEWLFAALGIEDLGYRVAFVRDTAKAHEPLDGFETMPDAALHIEHRANLYADAACNLFVDNGPAWLAVALNAPMLMLKPCTEGIGGLFGAGKFRKNGMEPGTQLPTSPPWQRIVWQEDRAGYIVDAFRDFMAEQGKAAA